MSTETQEQKKLLHKPKTRGNGTGSVYKLPNGKYRAAITLGYTEEGKRIYKTKSGFKTKKEGVAYIDKLREDAAAPKEIKFFKLYEEWSRHHFEGISKSKQTAYHIAYNKCEPLHYRNISEIRLKDIQTIVDKCIGGYYPKHDIKVLCNQIYKFAMENDHAVKNYAQFIKLPTLEKSKRDAFSEEEIKSLWEDYNNGNGFTGYILVMIYTGMRYGELNELLKQNIFLDKSYMIGGIKTDAGVDRQIVIADKIKPIIERIYGSCKKKLLEMSEKLFYEQYYDALDRAKVRRLTPHCCRHTFATRMAESGAQPAIIKEMAGHENYSTTLQYTHISLVKKLAAANGI